MNKMIRINDSDSSSSDSAAVLSSSAKRSRQSSLAKKSKRKTNDIGEIATELIEPPETSCAASQVKDALYSLPPEILAIIIRKLDTTSISNLHYTCRHLRNVVHMPGVVKTLDLSLSTLATVKTNLDIFHDISGHVRVLNLSGVYDLDLPALVRALEHMESLVDLDVSFTNITMPDFLQFRKLRPTLQGLAINFDLDGCCQVSEKDMLEYQQAFEGLRRVHFVYTQQYERGLCFGKPAILMLLCADLFRFTLTCVCGGDEFDWAQTIDWNDTGTLRVTQLQIRVLQDQDPAFLPLLPCMEVEKCEIIIFVQCICCSTQVLATPLVKKIICERFAAKIGNLPESTPFSLLNTELEGQCNERREMFVMLWHKERNQFEGEFRSELLSLFKEYYLFSVRSDALTQIPPGFKWHKLTHVISSAPSSLELNYGEAFKEEDDIKLHLFFYPTYDLYLYDKRKFEPLRVINNYDFLKKISHLSLSINHYSEHYNSNFFNHVFEHCDTLVTFQINSRTVDPMLLQSIGKSKSIKNIYIEGKLSYLRPTFSVLSECRNLERFVYLMRYELVETQPDPKELFKKCNNLYYICIQADIDPEDYTRDGMLTSYNEAKSSLGRDAMTIDIRCLDQHQYTPYMYVFNVF